MRRHGEGGDQHPTTCHAAAMLAVARRGRGRAGRAEWLLARSRCDRAGSAHRGERPLHELPLRPARHRLPRPRAGPGHVPERCGEAGLRASPRRALLMRTPRRGDVEARRGKRGRGAVTRVQTPACARRARKGIWKRAPTTSSVSGSSTQEQRLGPLRRGREGGARVRAAGSSVLSRRGRPGSRRGDYVAGRSPPRR